MSIDNIQHSLDSFGYHTFSSTVYLVVARKASDEDPRLIDLADFFCRVYPEGGRFKVIYNYGNMPDIELFDSDSQVIAFIKKRFPL